MAEFMPRGDVGGEGNCVSDSNDGVDGGSSKGGGGGAFLRGLLLITTLPDSRG